MLYRAKQEPEETARLRADIEPVARGMGFSLVELTLSRHRGSCQLRLVAAKPGCEGGIGTEDLSRLHRALLPRLELALNGDFSAEISSPGIDRALKEGAEFACFIGQAIRCYLPEQSDWVRGRLKAADEHKIILETGDGERELDYEKIARAKLDG